MIYEEKAHYDRDDPHMFSVGGLRLSSAGICQDQTQSADHRDFVIWVYAR